MIMLHGFSLTGFARAELGTLIRGGRQLPVSLPALKNEATGWTCQGPFFNYSVGLFELATNVMAWFSLLSRAPLTDPFFAPMIPLSFYIPMSVCLSQGSVNQIEGP